MKFVLFVEGHTEQKAVPSFLKRWLDPRLGEPVGIKPVRFEGWPELVEDVERKAQFYLEGPTCGDVIAVVSLLDLYGPTIYPAHLQSAAQRDLWGKEHLEQRVNHERFRHFFAVHETEAWLLSQPAPQIYLLVPRATKELIHQTWSSVAPPHHQREAPTAKGIPTNHILLKATTAAICYDDPDFNSS